MQHHRSKWVPGVAAKQYGLGGHLFPYPQPPKSGNSKQSTVNGVCLLSRFTVYWLPFPLFITGAGREFTPFSRISR